MKKYEDLLFTVVYFAPQDVVTGSMTGNGDGTITGGEREPENWG